jgi:hypothetical protein
VSISSAINSKVNEFFAKLQQGRPVDPPSAPPPTHMDPVPFELPIPYALEEMPRTFLHLLKISPEVSPQVRSYIDTWLTDFDEKIVSYMHQRYGDGVDQVMDMITRSVMNQQHEQTQEAAKAEENDVLADLEKQLRGDDSGEAGTDTA